MMKITKRSLFTSIPHTMELPITKEQIARWQAGTLIQRAMPQLTAAQREFMLTGCTQDEWQQFMDEGNDA
jgi:hypothetical protein